MASFPPKTQATTRRPGSRRSLAQIPQASNSEIDKENYTADVGAIHDHKRAPRRNSTKDKKSRSKSLGPGGLDVLQDGSGNRRQSTAAFPLKSILKPSVPLSPPRNIPSFEESRKSTPPRRSPRKSVAAQSKSPAGTNDLIDFSTPPSAPVVGANNLDNPFDTFDPLSNPHDGKTGRQADEDHEEKERLEIERREKEKKEILEQREARRKSMANRRVSFAPEATLHTWNVVELGDDNTSSTISTNSTRRDSGASPVNQDGKQLQLSPSSGTVENDEAFSSSPFSGSDDAAPANLPPGNEDTPFSDSDAGESTAMSIDNMTEQSISSTHSSGSTTDSSGRLDRSLQQAAMAAGTRGIGHDEHGDMSPDFANHEIAGAFKPWVKKGPDRLSFSAEDLSSNLDQENVNPFNAPKSPQNRARKSPVVSGSPDKIDRRKSVTNKSTLGDQTMEFTNVIGGIAPNSSPSKDFSGESETAGDEEMTMEFTSVFGGVIARDSSPAHENDPYTNANRPDGYGAAGLYPDIDENASDGESEIEMDMTGAVGGILPPIEERTEPLEDETEGMDMTNAVGKILTPSQDQPGTRGGTVFEEPDANQPESSPFQEQVIPSPAKPAANSHIAAVASENGSPSFAKVQLQPRRSTSSRRSTTPTKQSPRRPTPETPTTPPRLQSPQKSAPRTPGSPSPSRSKTSRSASPKKSPKPLPAPLSAKQRAASPFRQDGNAARSTPSLVLQPSRRSSSGLGIDKEGLGSPRVAELLDRRRSIGDNTPGFELQTQSPRGVRFEDPKNLEKEIEELQLSHEDVSGGQPSPTSPNKETAPNLAEMIASLTPKKDKFKSRKSLHVGSAKGLLGKRPAELDHDEEDEDLTPKRLKGREHSPVKSVKLPAPPSKAETVGKSPRFSLQNVAELSPSKQISTTPKGPYPHKNIPVLSPVKEWDPQEDSAQPEVDENTPGTSDPNYKPIQLSEFLEMTNIHFMELTTTKRRHTLAPDTEKKSMRRSSSQLSSKGMGLGDCVAAGVCTVPMLELYQHSCRELKSYISEGRHIIRSIESETLADNPPLFQEYVNAPPDIRLLMDNQFRNVKTHARLLSKSMWYEWRMKLLEGLKQGLDRHKEDMEADDTVLSKKETLLSKAVPQLSEQHARLEGEARNLERMVEEMESCDQEELRNAREKLSGVDAEIAEKKSRLEEMQALLQDKDNVLENGLRTKEQLVQQLSDAERLREECRGWNVGEVQSLKASVHSVEKRTGWAVLSVTPEPESPFGPTLAMLYRNEFRLDFNPGALSSSQRQKNRRSSSKPNKDMPLTLSYSPTTRHAKSYLKATPPGKSLLLGAIRARSSQIARGSTNPKSLLSIVSRTWDTACALHNEIKMLGFCGVTRCKPAADEQSQSSPLKVRCILLGQRPISRKSQVPQGDDPMRSRVDIEFTVKPRPLEEAEPVSNAPIDIDVHASITKVYGFGDTSQRSSQSSESKLTNLLNKMIQPNQDSSEVQTRFGKGVWRDSLKELERKIFLH